MKVLIAEDDPVSSYVLATRIRKAGHEVFAAENGLQAWIMYQQEHPRLVITDWMMPQMNGLQFCRKIRDENRSQYTYVILLTALGGKEHYLEGMEAGADDFVTKPIDADGLSARLRVAERIINLHTEVSQLEGLLPICAYCKQVRDEQDTWHSLESYVSEKTETAFDPTLCPDCANLSSMESEAHGSN